MCLNALDAVNGMMSGWILLSIKKRSTAIIVERYSPLRRPLDFKGCSVLVMILTEAQHKILVPNFPWGF
jgi:hypothetical protein